MLSHSRGLATAFRCVENHRERCNELIVHLLDKWQSQTGSLDPVTGSIGSNGGRAQQLSSRLRFRGFAVFRSQLTSPADGWPAEMPPGEQPTAVSGISPSGRRRAGIAYWTSLRNRPGMMPVIDSPDSCESGPRMVIYPFASHCTIYRGEVRGYIDSSRKVNVISFEAWSLQRQR